MQVHVRSQQVVDHQAEEGRGRRESAPRSFTRLARDIMVAAREGGGDESANPRLKLGDRQARARPICPKTISNAPSKRALEKLPAAKSWKYATKVTVLKASPISSRSSPTTRIAPWPKIKHAFSKHEGSLATNGAVMWQFDQKGYHHASRATADFDEVFLEAAEAGAEDVVDEDGDRHGLYRRAMNSRHRGAGACHTPVIQFDDCELRWIPQNELDSAPSPKRLQNMRLMETAGRI